MTWPFSVRLLGVAVSKIRKGAVDFDTDKLAVDVEAAFGAYPDEKIGLMWGTLEHIYKAILEYMERLSTSGAKQG